MLGLTFGEKEGLGGRGGVRVDGVAMRVIPESRISMETGMELCSTVNSPDSTLCI